VESDRAAVSGPLRIAAVRAAGLASETVPSNAAPMCARRTTIGNASAPTVSCTEATRGALSLKRRTAQLETRSGKPNTGHMPSTTPVANDLARVTGEVSDCVHVWNG